MTDPILEALGMSSTAITKPAKKKTKQSYTAGKEEDQSVYEEAYSLQEKKMQEEIRKLKIGNEKELGNLIEKRLVVAILNEIGHTAQTVFVDRGRREASIMAAKLGIPEKERELEKMLNDQDEKGINTLINVIEKLCDDGVFD